MKRIHFLGIGGSGISGVAMLASKMGYEVSGCDLESTTAYAKNIYKGHSQTHVKNIDLVVVTPAVFYQDSENPEVLAAKKENKLMTWQEFLGKVLLKDKKVIAIAGTHGKSTTTAMAGKLLIDNGFDPIVVVGARIPEWGENARFGKGKYAVVEADEFNNNFLNYNPDIEIINNVEFDHPDFFKNKKEVLESFSKFKKRLKGQRILITQKDSLNKKFNLKILGEHNQKNANMVFVLGKKLKIEDENIINSIENFSGIGRRLELIGTRNGIKIYDDYAHHPTAIKATINAIRKRYPNDRLFVIDEPHGYSRTKALLSKYKNAFRGADKVIIAPIFKARDKDTFGVTSESIVKVANHKNIISSNSFAEIKNFLKKELKPNDIVLVMGAGKSYLLAHEIKEMLPVKFSDITTFHIGGHIKKYFEVENKEDVAKVVDFAKKKKLPIFVIGRGSDILANDKSFKGVVIRYTGKKISFEESGKNVLLTAEAGFKWDKMVEAAVTQNLSGIECLSGIPGTVGAAPIQNIGAYGQELKETFIKLEAFDIDKGKLVTFKNKDCDFGYRESIFKKPDHWQKFIIISITLNLIKNGSPAVQYESLKDYLKEKKIKKPTLQEVRQYILTIRKSKFESPHVAGNAGSFFKNPVVSREEFEMLRGKFSDIKYFETNKGYKIPAGWFIEKAGWKGKRYKDAAVSARHALILINPEQKAKALDVMELSEKIITDVKKKFGIKLEREVQLINF